MLNQYRNIYQIARESSGFTQEKAAELLNISVESIRAYEGDKRIPPNNVVVNMVEIYNAQFLAFKHLKNSELGQKYLPEVEVKSLSISILNLQKEIKKFNKCEELLIEIGSDGIISDDEKANWINVQNELNSIVEAILALKYSKEG
ncbi:MAG: helix-turn-helix domain-containing protein [Clostridiales bacterium]|nr:helix-turn-helix domain-containing protein [Clostridiales bacterium]